MYFATPPNPGTVPASLRIAAVRRRSFTGEGEGSPRLQQYTEDLARPYGVGVREDVLARSHTSYAAMSDAMVADLVPEASPPDLIVIAYTVPEIDPRRCVTTRLNQHSAGDPFGFAVSDQGTAAPFTALALIGEHLAAGLAHRAVLIVVEQGDVPYETPPGTVVPGQDTAVALLLEAAGSHRVTALRRRTGVALSDVDAMVAAELAALPDGPSLVTVIGPDRVVADMVCTAPWWTLTEELGAAGRTVVVDHDPDLGYLSVLVVDTE
ncbi:4-hydroxymandelate oxidase [Allocatelliglobosispora scoriae]|uniref:4-hydroxymandelate oxidase n=1 Tax=Allocatelliglobosispora scoriae TaxID=643052 RepID=A0A841C2H7_9ACTN|nr:hypothetical protein [Allocatelliglobosispora scoriae]MBB5874096.1 4-hydroxymandelate oxidase [Allocatelliglobosispora scoriae]